MLKRLLFLILAVIIFFVPLSFGAVHLWAKTVLNLLILTVFYLFTLNSINGGALEYRKNPLNVLFTLFAVYIIFQIVLHVTESPYRSYLALETVLLYFALFFAVTNSIRYYKEIERIIFLIIIAGFIVSVLGILQSVTCTSKIYWIYEIGRTNFFGTFLNENHFAAYISMIALVALGTLITYISSGKKISWDLSLRQNFLNLADNLLNRKVIFVLFSSSIMITALFLSASRGGMVFFLLSLVFFSLSILSKKISRKSALLMLAGILLAFLLLNWIGATGAISALHTIFLPNEFNEREMLYIDGLKMLKDHRVLGIGIGAFSSVFPLYKSVYDGLIYEHLHNDILQFLIESGLLGFFIITITFFIFIAVLAAATFRSSELCKYYLGLGILSSFLYLGMHSLIDFGFRINSISALFTILLALFLSIVNLKSEKHGLEVAIVKRRIVSIKSVMGKKILYALSSVIYLYIAINLLRPLTAYALIKNNPDYNSFKIAMMLDPKNDDIIFNFYKFILEQFKENKITKDTACAQAAAAIDKSLMLNPCKTDYVVARAKIEFWRKNYEKADELFKKASYMEPNNPVVLLNYSYALFWEGIDERDDNRKQSLLKRGLNYYEMARFLSKGINFTALSETGAAFQFLKDRLREEGIIL